MDIRRERFLGIGSELLEFIIIFSLNSIIHLRLLAVKNFIFGCKFLSCENKFKKNMQLKI